ncbi:MAG: hypothetical protein UT60_C0014G0023, partial [candidate division CPR2 bacterium GW2011_GWD2_39_7]
MKFDYAVVPDFLTKNKPRIS